MTIKELKEILNTCGLPDSAAVMIRTHDDIALDRGDIFDFSGSSETITKYSKTGLALFLDSTLK